MEIPIYIEGEAEGRLTIRRQGAMTLLEARTRDVGRLVRLTVFGGEESFYLGVPAPAEGEMRLARRLSPSEMRRFPREPAYAAERKMVFGEKTAGTATHVLWLGGRPHYFP